MFPFPEPSAADKEAATAILDSFRSWAKDTVDTRKHDHDGRFTDETRAGMAGLGLMGLWRTAVQRRTSHFGNYVNPPVRKGS